MITEFVMAWEKRKRDLEMYLRNHNQSEYDEYSKLVKLLFEIVINPELKKGTGWHDGTYSTRRMTVIDDGDYQGTYVFVIPKNAYQPDVEEYVYTHVDYGSCSGCDTLQGIHCYNVNVHPTENQLRGYMDLCLHLLQKCNHMHYDDPAPAMRESMEKAEHTLLRIEDILDMCGSVEQIREELDRYFEKEKQDDQT